MGDVAADEVSRSYIVGTASALRSKTNEHSAFLLTFDMLLRDHAEGDDDAGMGERSFAAE